eukprot:1882363-Rhodomonas_salina.3
MALEDVVTVFYIGFESPCRKAQERMAGLYPQVDASEDAKRDEKQRKRAVEKERVSFLSITNAQHHAPH